VIAWLWRWGPAVAFMGAIFIVSGMPDVGTLPARTSDKAAHFAAYGLLAVLLIRAFAGAAWAGCTASAGHKSWTLAAVYGVSDELHQSFVPGRTPSVGDGLADAAGAALGVVVVLAVARARRVKEREV
jgi:VanZ family protein